MKSTIVSVYKQGMPTKTKTTDCVVTRKFLLNLADDIYEPKTRKFLRLCNGTLQNGPDPKDAKRSMHCGLGELYFAMTGRQPNQDRVNEDKVIDKAIELSCLSPKVLREKAIVAIEALRLDSELEHSLISYLKDANEISAVESEFREILSMIPDVNDEDLDDGCLDGTCSYETYRNRSMRVARQLRAAAKLLPE
jgi:hypothetical protein